MAAQPHDRSCPPGAGGTEANVPLLCFPGAISTQGMLTTAQPGAAQEPAQPTGILRAPWLGQGLKFQAGAVSSLSPSPGHSKCHPLELQALAANQSSTSSRHSVPRCQTCLARAVWMSLCMLVCWTPSRKGCSSPRDFGKALKARKTRSFITGSWDEL